MGDDRDTAAQMAELTRHMQEFARVWGEAVTAAFLPFADTINKWADAERKRRQKKEEP